MFVTRKKLETLEYYIDRNTKEVRELEELHFKLVRRHQKLLTHLGLMEVEIPGTTEIMKIK